MRRPNPISMLVCLAALLGTLLAIFRGDDSLARVHAVGIPDQMGSDGRGTAAFAAVDSQGRIYSMGRGRCADDPDVSCLRRYTLDWNAVGTVAVDGLALTFETEIPLYDASGQPILLKHYSGRLYVDPSASSGDGRVGSPYASIADALGRGSAPPSDDRPAVWGGSTVVLRPGAYPAQELAADAPGVYVQVGAGGSATLGP